MKGTLYVIGLPIGNVGDISEHAKETLQKLKLLACEDTRHAVQLLRNLFLPLDKKLISVYKDNERKRLPQLLGLLEDENDLGLMVSRGMPSISDPGFLLIREAIQKEIPIKIIPGPSAGITALIASGLPSDKFIFLGFPPRKAGKQKNFFKKYTTLQTTLIFYESPRRLIKTLKNLEPVFNSWHIAICRELTKVHEEIIRGNYSDILNSLRDKTILGEITVVLSNKK